MYQEALIPCGNLQERDEREKVPAIPFSLQLVQL